MLEAFMRLPHFIDTSYKDLVLLVTLWLDDGASFDAD
jgi:hypothetical protein